MPSTTTQAGFGPPSSSTTSSTANRLINALSTLLLTQHGYTFLLPLLLLFELSLCTLTILKVRFTEIDFQTYLAQARLFLDGQRDYTLLDPSGGSGPCVYPAAHLYLFSAFNYLTHGGQHMLAAQAAFAAMLGATLLMVAALAKRAALPPLLLVPMVLSKRLHSIFLLRMFNDPVALLGFYAALLSATRKRWTVASLLFSLALGIKMNILLFLPAYAIVLVRYQGLTGLLRNLVVVAAVQLALAAPFLADHADVYWSRAFDLSRRFLYQWTVNWRFVDEKTFLSDAFARALLGCQLLFLAMFGLARWTGIAEEGIGWAWRHISRRKQNVQERAAMTEAEVRELLTMMFTSNLIGILCSRSLHYQFYSWYFHQIPFLLWTARLPLPVKLAMPAALEWCWNVFPSSDASSLTLLGCHTVLLAGVWAGTAYSPLSHLQHRQADRAPALAEKRASSAAVSDDLEDEQAVQGLLFSDGSVGQKVPAKEDGPDVGQHDADGDDEEIEIDFDEDGAKARENALAKSIRRRITLRKKLVAGIGRVLPLLRIAMVLAAIALLVVLPDPHSPVSKGVYVDENALQPGQAKVYFDYFDVTYADMLSEKVERLGKYGDAAARAELVRSELASYGLRAYTQNYTYPAGLPPLRGEEGPRSGTNVYARSASPRIDGREAVILSASWKSQWHGEEDPFADPSLPNDTTQRRTNVRGIATLLVLARYLGTQNFLSKDLIFVVSDGYLEGINAWSTAYFSGGTRGGGRRGTSAFAGGRGAVLEEIQDGGSTVWNALSLDYPSDSFSALALLYEGIDGQLPNMDALNSLLKIVERVGGGVPVRLFGEGATTKEVESERPRRLRPLLDKVGLGWVDTSLYESGVRAALHQLKYGATGRTSGPHGVFQRHHIDALTLYAIPARGPYGFFQLGRIVESYVRSLSNLLERLHHSQFLYLLVSPRRFVPIGVAIVVPLLISVYLTFTGLSLWYAAGRAAEERRQEWELANGVGVGVGVDADEAGHGIDDVDCEEPSRAERERTVARRWLREVANGTASEAEVGRKAEEWSRLGSRPYASALAILAGCVAANVAVGRIVASDVTRWTGETDAKTFGSIPGSGPILVLLLPLLILPTALPHLFPLPRLDRTLPALLHLYAGLALSVLSILNFPLSQLLSLLLLPLLRLSTLRLPLRLPLLFLLHPLGLVLLLRSIGAAVALHEVREGLAACAVTRCWSVQVGWATYAAVVSACCVVRGWGDV